MNEKPIAYLHVRSTDLEPGDEFFYVFGRKPNRDWDQDRATVISVDPASQTIVIERKDKSQRMDIPMAGSKDVFGGPKLAAANADRSLVAKAGYGYWWVGRPEVPAQHAQAD